MIVQDTVTRPDEATLIIEHVFDAPRSLVWDAWTMPKHLAEWWGPEHFTNPVCEIDVRVGGTLHIEMQGPDGATYPMTGTFDEVVKPERLVYTFTPLDAAGEKMFKLRQTAQFTECEGKTRLTLTAQILWATPTAVSHLKGMEAGLKQSFWKLDQMLTSQNEGRK